jgi:hypothetical protein
MKIEEIRVKNNGYVHCHSNFYTSRDSIDQGTEYCFFIGINKMKGEIDSGVWAISYLLSMYTHRPKDFVLFENPDVSINGGRIISLEELSKYSCYMDKSYPLFASRTPINKLIAKGIKENIMDCQINDIQELFMIDSERFKLPLHAVGNEIFKAMAAIAYSHGKEVFCFPWLSEMRFDYYHENITFVLDTLEKLKKIVVLPGYHNG